MANPLKVEFQFDFGSPNAYLAELVIPAIERRTGVKFDYVPVLLGGVYKATGNMSPGESLRGIKNKPEFQEAGDATLPAPPHHHDVPSQSVLPGQHPDADARSGRSPIRRDVRAVFPRRLSPHVGSAEEDGRRRGVSRGVQVIGHRCRAARRSFAAGRCQEALDRSHGRRGQPRYLRLADFFVGSEMFFGKDQLRDVEESILEQSGRFAKSA